MKTQEQIENRLKSIKLHVESVKGHKDSEVFIKTAKEEISLLEWVLEDKCPFCYKPKV